MISEYLSKRLKSFGYAFQGIRTLLFTQAHARLHLLATVLIVSVGMYLGFSRWEWTAILLCIGLVWMAEAFNTALEFLADEVSLEQRSRIGKAKDVAAGGVLITALVSVGVAAVILSGHLLHH